MLVSSVRLCRLAGATSRFRSRPRSGRRSRWSKGSDGSRARPASWDLAKLMWSARYFGNASTRSRLRPVSGSRKNALSERLREASSAFAIVPRVWSRKCAKTGSGTTRVYVAAPRNLRARRLPPGPRARIRSSIWDVTGNAADRLPKSAGRPPEARPRHAGCRDAPEISFALSLRIYLHLASATAAHV